MLSETLRSFFAFQYSAGEFPSSVAILPARA